MYILRNTVSDTSVILACTVDREIFTLKIIRVKIFRVDKFSVVPFDPRNFSA